MSNHVCPECGARLTPGTERCDLCGSPLSNEDEAQATPEEVARDDIPDPGAPAQSHGVYCNACGWENPSGANFCSRCGTALQQVTPAFGSGTRPVDAGTVSTSSRSGHDDRSGDDEASGSGTSSSGQEVASPGEDTAMTRHVALLVGLAVLVVVALYLITVVSSQRSDSETATTAEAPADVRSAAVIDEYEAIPIGARYAPVVDSLRAEIGSGEGPQARDAHRELVAFLIDIGRIDRAAIEQQRLARATEGPADWQRAADLLYDWMESVNNDRKTDVALLAIQAFENVLAERPDDLDARARMAWAYQYDPQNPMQAIEQTNTVLEADPDHLAANYNRAVFLLRINRVEEAVAQFERVAELAEDGSIYDQRAEAWLQSVRRQQANAP